MNFEDEFDKIIRQKAEEAQFAYDDKNWQKLAGLRMQQTPAAALKTSWKKFLLPAAALLIFTGLFLSWYFTPVPKTVAMLTTPTMGAVLSDNEKTEEKSSGLPTDQKRSEPETKTAKDSPTQVMASDSDKNNNVRMTKQESAKPDQIRVSDRAMTSQATEQTNVKSELNPKSNADLITELNTEFNPSESVSKSASASVSQNPVASNSDEKDNVPSVSPIEANTVFAGKAPSSFNAKGLKPVFTEAEPLRYQWLPNRTLIMQPPVDKAEANITISALPKGQEDYVMKNNHLLFSAYAGVHYGLGWSGTTKGSKEGAGTNYFGGIDVHSGLTEKIRVSAGLQYYNFSNMVDPYYVAEKKEYGFGYSQAFTSVTTDHLVFLAIPLKVSYQLTQTLNAGVGLNTGYLVAAHSRVDVYGITDGAASAVTSSGTKAIYEGTKSLNMMGSVFLNIRLTDHFSGFSELQYGFTDLFENYKHSNKRQNSSGLRLGLNYYFGKK